MNTSALNAPSPNPDLPAYVKAFLATCPKTGGGVHRWLFGAALRLHRAQCDKQEIARLLEAATADCGRVVTFREIQGAIVNSERVLSEPGAGNGAEHRPWIPKSRFREPVLRRIAGQLPVEDIRGFIASRSEINPEDVTSDGFLRALYAPGEKIVVFTDFKSQGQALWPHCPQGLPKGGKDGVWFLTNPVTGKCYWNPRQQKRSRRSEEAVTSFRFAVLESDEADVNDWLKCLAQIPLPIAAIYESGGRSIHALVQIDAATKAQWDQRVRKMKPLIVTLGADPSALTAVRLSRLPQAMRGDRIQKLLYLKPSPNAVPICAKDPRQN